MDSDTNPAGYEPENSLRRISAAVRPVGLKREGAMRRKSALDRPTSLHIPKPAAVPSEPDKNLEVTPTEDNDVTSYEPENSLRRVRKVSDQSAQGRAGGRQRRTGLVRPPSAGTLAPPEITTTKLSPGIVRKEILASTTDSTSPRMTILTSDSNCVGSLSTDSGCHSGDSSPTTPCSPPFKQPLFTLSIPEDEAVSSEGSTTATSPRPLRKLSKAKNLTALKLGGSSPALYRSKSRDSMASAGKTRRSSLTTPSPVAETAGAVMSPQEIATPTSSAIQKAKLKAQASHINQTRYWDWYLLNASYSWKNFNNHKTYCY